MSTRPSVYNTTAVINMLFDSAKKKNRLTNQLKMQLFIFIWFFDLSSFVQHRGKLQEEFDTNFWIFFTPDYLITNI